jgi:hypothetical protein
VNTVQYSTYMNPRKITALDNKKKQMLGCTGESAGIRDDETPENGGTAARGEEAAGCAGGWHEQGVQLFLRGGHSLHQDLQQSRLLSTV